MRSDFADIMFFDTTNGYKWMFSIFTSIIYIGKTNRYSIFFCLCSIDRAYTDIVNNITKFICFLKLSFFMSGKT